MVDLIRPINALAFKIFRKDISKNLIFLQAMKSESKKEKNFRRKVSLNRTLAYVKFYVPYYRDLFKKIAFNPDNVLLDLGYLNDIPYLTRETILSDPKLFFSDEYSNWETSVRKTTGSSGHTLSFRYCSSDLSMASATLRFLDDSIKKPFDRNEVYLKFHNQDGFGTKFPLANLAAGSIKDAILRRLSLKISELDPFLAENYINQIKIKNPFLIHGLPSTLKALLSFSSDTNAAKKLAEYFISTGETISAQDVNFIENKIGCRVINRYGSAEFGAVAQSFDNAQTLSFVDGIVLPECFKINNHSEIVLTTLVNKGMPLIRYRTGDLGAVEEDDCGTFILKDIQGRLHEMLEINGKIFTTAFLSDYLHKNFQIHDFQVIKVSTKITIRLITDHPILLPEISKVISSYLKADIKVERMRYSDLTRFGMNAKFSHLIKV